MGWALSELRDPGVIETYLRRAPILRLYELGDLSAPYWSRTRWFAASSNAGIDALLMTYDAKTAGATPILLAMESGSAAARWLLEHVGRALPRRFYVHASETILEDFQTRFLLSPPIPHVRMGLLKSDSLAPESPAGVSIRRVRDDEPATLSTFYDEAYPGHWFSPEMLAHGRYFGAFSGDRLLAAAGTHVLAPASGVAALGNIATLPDRRGLGLATAVTAALCRSLKESISSIGLNVREDNIAARRCYERLGFAAVARFYEFYAEQP